MSEELEWFLCLFGNVRNSMRADGSSSKATNRTVIVLTAKPLALLTLMNASEENGIADAADKASKLLNTACEKMYSGMEMPPHRFEFICVLGPVADFSLAQRITHEWIRSRGGYPRATCAQDLSRRYGIGFHVNMEAIYALTNLDVSVVVLESDSSGALLEIRPRKS
jgi:hypothetical protein